MSSTHRVKIWIVLASLSCVFGTSFAKEEKSVIPNNGFQSGSANTLEAWSFANKDGGKGF